MSYKMKEVSQKTGISSYTIRYYEKEGILPPIERDSNGIRIFSEDNLFWLEMVICLKKTQMPMTEIKKIVQLSQMGDETIPERKRLLKEHRDYIDQQMKELEESRKKVDFKIAYYEGTGSCD